MSHPAFQIIDEFLQAADSSAQARRNDADAGAAALPARYQITYRTLCYDLARPG